MTDLGRDISPLAHLGLAAFVICVFRANMRSITRAKRRGARRGRIAETKLNDQTIEVWRYALRREQTGGSLS